MSLNMRLKVESLDGKEIELNMYEQSQVYKTFRMTCTGGTIEEYMSESDDFDTTDFIDDNARNTVITRVLDIMDDYHVSEDDAIETVFSDNEYIRNFITEQE